MGKEGENKIDVESKGKAGGNEKKENEGGGRGK